MKKLKKLLSTVICAALLLTAIPLNSITASATAESDFIYTVSNGYAVIKGYAGNEENVEIPSTLGGYTVTTVDALAFYNCATIKNIILPDTVTYIGDSAFFGCENLETVFFSDKVSDMGTFVFSGCCNLKEINVSENNFYYSSLDGVLFNDTQSMLYIYPAGKTELAYVIPNTVTAIAERAFFQNSNLISVSIPASVITINTSVFNDCTNLADINVSSENTRYSSIDGVLVDKDYN